MRKVIVGKKYKHFKGNLYEVIALGYDTDNLNELVIYKSLYDNKVWVRRYDEFISLVDKEKYPNVTQKYRFEEYD